MNSFTRIAIVAVVASAVGAFVAITVEFFPGILIAPILAGAIAYPILWITEPEPEIRVTSLSKKGIEVAKVAKP